MTTSHEITAEGHDMLSLLFHFLDELLFMFCAEPFLVAKVSILIFGEVIN
jgi:SHS2 domain-containing protein